MNVAVVWNNGTMFEQKKADVLKGAFSVSLLFLNVLWVEEKFHAFFCLKNVEESHEGINNVDLFFY